MPALQWKNNELTIEIYLQPKASRDEIIGLIDNCIKVRITAAPSENKANKHLCKFLAKQFSVAQSKVSILRGHKSRYKTVRILDAQIPEILDITSPKY